MSRRRAAIRREIVPDPKYGSVLVSKLVNIILKNGAKSVAERIVYGSFDMIKKNRGSDPLKVFEDGIANVKPAMEVESVRVGGANYQVPRVVNDDRGIALGLRLVVAAAAKRSGRSMIEKLSEEIFDAANNRGAAVKKKEDIHKMAESNRAFSHFAKWR